MLDVLKARWQSRGWRPMEKEDSEPMALEFIRELDRHKVPHRHYRELYQRSMDLRAARIAQGLSCEDFSIDLMLACWPNLKTEIYQRDVAAGRILTTTAQTNCQRCFGTGMERILDEEGELKGYRKGCQHRYVDEVEPSTQEGLEAVIATAHEHAQESDIEICRRLRVELTQDWVAALKTDKDADAHQLYQAIGFISRVIKYLEATRKL